MLDNIIKKFHEKNACLYSIAKMEDGEVQVKYVTPASKCHDSYSVAKVFTVTAVGLLYDEGKISLDDCVYDILKEDFPKEFDPKWKQVTIHHLLAHKFGLKSGRYFDIDVDDTTQYPTDDYLHYVVSVDLPNELDGEYVYSDIPHYILSRVVARKAGQEMCDYLMERLFNPLRFHEVAWSRCPHGYSIGATGLYIRTEDMLKLGVVYLNDGCYEEKRIVSAKWCDLVLQNGYELKERPNHPQTYQKGGMYGQNLYISKAGHLVIAWHGYSFMKCDVLDELGM